MSTNRLLGVMLGVAAALVLVVGGLTAVLLISGDSGGGGGGSGGERSGVTTDGGSRENDGDASGRLRLISSDPVTLDPHLATDALSAEYIVEIYSGLVTISPPPELEIKLDLAESVEVSDGGLVYTFVLRDDIFFSITGRRVTADDIKWSMERAASAELSSPVALAYLGDIVGAREKFFRLAEDIRGIEVIDDRTIRFTLDAPKPFFLAKLTYPTAFVVDRQQIEGNPNNWTRRPNGTGPYKLTEWRVGERIVLEPNTRSHLPPASVKEVIYALSGGSALTRFENDEVDVASISVNDIERARDPGSALNALFSQWPQFTISYIAFNNQVAPFDDVHVRRAMAMAIDRAKIADVTFNNMLVPATGVLPPGLPGYTPEDKTFAFDPDAARAEFALSRYASAEDLPPIVLTEVGGGAEARIDTQAFLEQWKNELGIIVEIRQTDFATFLADQDAGRLQMFNAGWIVDYPDPENILDLLFHSQSTINRTGYSNAEVDRILEQARVESDPELRLRLYQQAERLVVSDAGWLPLYFSQSHVVVNAAVGGWFEPPMVIPRLRFITVDR